jgi:hypothetical protein
MHERIKKTQPFDAVGFLAVWVIDHCGITACKARVQWASVFKKVFHASVV